MQHALSASYGRMAFYYTLEALDLPRDSEIIFPALTFWAVPEMARVLGFRPKFVDIDPGKHVDICNVLNHFDPFQNEMPCRRGHGTYLAATRLRFPYRKGPRSDY